MPAQSAVPGGWMRPTKRSDRYRRFRIGREDQERTVQNWQSRREHGDKLGVLASRSGCAVGISPGDTAKPTGVGSTLGFAPEPAEEGFPED
jgi:hypothetical protein